MGQGVEIVRGKGDRNQEKLWQHGLSSGRLKRMKMKDDESKRLAQEDRRWTIGPFGGLSVHLVDEMERQETRRDFSVVTLAREQMCSSSGCVNLQDSWLRRGELRCLRCYWQGEGRKRRREGEHQNKMLMKEGIGTLRQTTVWTEEIGTPEAAEEGVRREARGRVEEG